MNAELTEKIKSWLIEKKPEVTTIEDDQDLMGTGVLDSLQFVNFLLFIEHIRGDNIPEEQVVPEKFTSVKTIINSYF